MNCAEAREQLPALLYGELDRNTATLLERHVATCSACRHEFDELSFVQKALDSVPAPDVKLDLPKEIYYQEMSRGRRHVLRLRKVSAAIFACAAALILSGVYLRLQVHMEPGRLIVAWGTLPAVTETATPSPDAEISTETRQEGSTSSDEGLPAAAEERLRVLNELVLALAKDIEARDQRQHQALTRLQAGIQEMQRQGNYRWTATERDLAALYAAQFVLTTKGAPQ